MRRSHVIASLGALLLVSTAGPVRSEPVAYPAKGQSADQQNRDEYECHQWAGKETGVDPVALAEKATAQQPSGGKGALGGALAGAGVGAMEGDAGAGALHGAGMARLIGMIRARRQLEQQRQAQGAETSALHDQLDKYDRAYAACLTGRGYSVK